MWLSSAFNMCFKVGVKCTGVCNWLLVKMLGERMPLTMTGGCGILCGEVVRSTVSGIYYLWRTLNRADKMAPPLANTPASCSKQATQLSCCRRLLAAKVRWTVCLSLTRLLRLLSASIRNQNKSNPSNTRGAHQKPLSGQDMRSFYGHHAVKPLHGQITGPIYGH